MIKIGNDVKDIKFGNKQVVKVYKGKNIVWESVKSVIWNTEQDIIPWVSRIKIPTKLAHQIKNKRATLIKIGSYKDIPGSNLKEIHEDEDSYLILTTTIYDLLKIRENISKGTKITVIYE